MARTSKGAPRSTPAIKKGARPNKGSAKTQFNMIESSRFQCEPNKPFYYMYAPTDLKVLDAKAYLEEEGSIEMFIRVESQGLTPDSLIGPIKLKKGTNQIAAEGEQSLMEVAEHERLSVYVSEGCNLWLTFVMEKVQ